MTARVRLRLQKPNHVWAYDFVVVRTEDGIVVQKSPVARAESLGKDH